MNLSVQTSSLSAQAYSCDPTGIFVPCFPVHQRTDEYSPRAFPALAEMQAGHFWFCGRRRFVHRSFEQHVRPLVRNCCERLTGLDLGCGCGGWIHFLRQRSGHLFSELAIADLAREALEYAGDLLGDTVIRYQADLLRLGWRDRWDVIFLLDVLEHIPEDQAALRQVHDALRPGGLVFVTTPALRIFWSYQDLIGHHRRRYSRPDFVGLAESTELELLDTRYFMFFLSPLLWLARAKRRQVSQMTDEEKRELVERTHRAPPRPLNALLSWVFGLETPIGHAVRFPWGTSILAVLRKPLR